LTFKPSSLSDFRSHYWLEFEIMLHGQISG
jgi:hypothetical protein